MAKTKEICWHCGTRRVVLFNRLGQGVCYHCHAKATAKTCDNCRKRHYCSQEGEDCTGWGR